MFEKKRFISGFILAVLVVLFVLYAPISWFKLVMALVIAACLNEFMTIALPKHPSSSPKLGVVLG
ncbi:MAG: hypothetical protein JNK65_01615, partial [Deltaproteobacteria bacterium]|nr:hypothetical protein [Deltaproteobacteria bacterium]